MPQPTIYNDSQLPEIDLSNADLDFDEQLPVSLSNSLPQPAAAPLLDHNGKAFPQVDELTVKATNKDSEILSIVFQLALELCCSGAASALLLDDFQNFLQRYLTLRISGERAPGRSLEAYLESRALAKKLHRTITSLSANSKASRTRERLTRGNVQIYSHRMALITLRVIGSLENWPGHRAPVWNWVSRFIQHYGQWLYWTAAAKEIT